MAPLGSTPSLRLSKRLPCSLHESLESHRSVSVDAAYGNIAARASRPSRRHARYRRRYAPFEAFEPRRLLSTTIFSGPISRDFDVTVDPNGTLTFTPQSIGTASYPTIDKISFVSSPTHGTLAINQIPISFTPGLNTIPTSAIETLSYTPQPGFAGVDSFGWAGSDSGSTSVLAQVWIAVGRVAPALSEIGPIYTTKSAAVPLTPSSFAPGFFDPNPGAQMSQIQITSLPAHGTIVVTQPSATNSQPVAANQTITFSDIASLAYIPTPGYTGTDAFQWKASDGTLSAPAPANFTLNIQSPYFFSEDNPTLNVAAEVSNTLPLYDFTYKLETVGFLSQSLAFIKFTYPPGFGTITIDGAPVSAGQSIPATPFSVMTYTPRPGYYGPDSFTWDGAAGPDGFTGTPTTTMIAVYRLSLSNVSERVPAGSPFSLPYADFLAANAGNSNATIKILSVPSHGNLTLSGSPLGANQTFALAPGYAVPVYTPSPGYSGPDSFGWAAAISLQAFGPPATAFLTVGKPTISDLHANVGSGIPTPLDAADFQAAVDITPLETIKILSLPAHGTLKLGNTAVTLNQQIPASAINNLTYSSAPNYLGADAFSWDGADRFSYTGSRARVLLTVVKPIAILGNNTAIPGKAILPSNDNFTDFGPWATNPVATLERDTRTYQLRNQTAATLTVNRISISGPNAADFSLLAVPAGSSIPARQSLPFTVVFKPTAAGRRVATVTVRLGGPPAPPSLSNSPAPASPPKQFTPTPPGPAASSRSAPLSPAKAPPSSTARFSPSPTPAISPTAPSLIPPPSMPRRATASPSASTTTTPTTCPSWIRTTLSHSKGSTLTANSFPAGNSASKASRPASPARSS